MAKGRFGMGACKDPTTQELNKRGYNLVKLPRVGIEPMDVLGREDKSMERLGSISEVWTSTVPVPTPGPPAATAGIEGSKTSDLDLGIGLKLLSDALAGLGSSVGLPSLNVGFKNAKKIQFKFVNVESTSVTPFALGKFLANGILDMSNPFAAHYFGNDETDEYIIFDVLKSDSISVTGKTDKGVDVAADISALSGALGSKVSIKATSSTTSEITFQGSVKATFAFKLYQVLFENGKWVPKGVGASEETSFGLASDGNAESVFGQGIVLNAGGRVRLKL
jgi:hypothetical protein